MFVINIISNNKCILNLDTSGIYQIELQGPAGLWTPIVLTEDDWIEYKVGGLLKRITFNDNTSVKISSIYREEGIQTTPQMRSVMIQTEITSKEIDDRFALDVLNGDELNEYIQKLLASNGDEFVGVEDEEEEDENEPVVTTRELTDVENNDEEDEEEDDDIVVVGGNDKAESGTQTPTDEGTQTQNQPKADQSTQTLSAIEKIDYYSRKNGIENSYSFDPEIQGYIFPEAVYNCSNRVKHLLGIINFPANQSQVVVSDHGPRFILIKCDQINTPMRFSNQLIH
ncbi:hypothetical protein TVAGG3_0542990, partial [Trichomonas vaginalis G3]|uniref:hypothetical protein n=1 Tax=Trichomonas vaginalis (strain ATCC PRA-98 / G3) TaxID=412133 RepID=UPI0021E5A483